MTVQHNRLTDQVTQNLKIKPTAVVFLDIEEYGNMALRIFGRSAPFLTHRKFKLSVEGEIPANSETEAGVPQGFVPVTVLYSLYINHIPAAPELAVDNSIYVPQKQERPVHCKLQRGLTVVNSWCERCKVEINEGKTRVIYFSTFDVLQLYGWNIHYVNNV
jgi:hypothetical protein